MEALQTPWTPRLLRTNNGMAWYVVRGWEFLRTPAGSMRKFRSEEAARAAGEKASKPLSSKSVVI